MTAILNPDAMSLAERAALDPDWQTVSDALSRSEKAALRYDWSWWRRPAQAIPPGMGQTFRTWFVRAGRGFGKTRTGGETTRQMIEAVPQISLIGPTAADVRDVMIEGESGVLSVFPPHQRPTYLPSKRRVEFHNGAVGLLFSAEEPDRLRGPQSGWLWADEPATYRYGKDVWDNASLGLRLGSHPWALLTGTPKPTAWLRQIDADTATVTTVGSTYENLGHLAEAFIENVLGRYEGTRLGAQELHAAWLVDVEGALWTQAGIEADRWSYWTPRPDWQVVVGVDPPGETADCGIVVAAAPARPSRQSDAVVLGDWSTPGPPEVWGQAVVNAWQEHAADAVVVEANAGGDMVRAVIHAINPDVPIHKARAADSKKVRAEPVSTLYARHRIHHVGFFPLLESQMVTWVPGEGKSPDRVDALVWAIAHLLPIDAMAPGSVISVASRRI